jgi:transposase-like protein
VAKIGKKQPTGGNRLWLRPNNYQSATVELVEKNLDAFAAKWDASHPSIAKSWRNNRDRIIPLFTFPEDIRKAIYTTNAIDCHSGRSQRIVGTFPVTRPCSS